MNDVINLWLESLSAAITASGWLAPLLALLAGVLTAFTPCSLSTVPLVIGYVGGTGEKDTGRSFLLSLTFTAGMAVTFTALGTAASLLGRLFTGAGRWWYILLGVLMLLMALQTWELFSFIPSTYALSRNKRRGYLGALLAGILGGLFSSPCATPVLVVLLALVAKNGSLAWGVLLLLLYSLGHGVLVIAAGTSVGLVQKLSSSGRYGVFSRVLKIVLGILMVLLAFYMFYLGF
ncbi:cytochrome c biogenesis CcdA family protein [Acetanaerobacterium elongatum]|uniref:Cytochrome C biogenesis protein transmembrane region n=1 Tax=Acetanaerobacterium elongatum TaxID=258515 RepID=A0A1G9XEM5_9FIRM|nr:cytochrome c biogenesis protein CcdA [Acetanaerobacterium elongatum]SDM94743.1 Cytochrome C biogenesis protein transmembrane region [Acetanaerobacterium elongatum]